MIRRGILSALALLAIGMPASAHTRSESHSVWEINGSAIDLVLTIPDVETMRIGRGDRPTDEAVKDYLAERIYPLADGRRCPLAPPIQTLSAASGFRKYDFTFQCPTSKNLEIRSSAFFDLIASHVNFAQIQNVATGEFTEQLITNERQTVALTGGADRLRRAGFAEYVGMGMMHIFTGIDHMSFLLGLVLISRRLRDLVFVVTGFTIGHSLTLALAVTGILRPHAAFIDALVALTIALIGAENIAVAIRRPGIVAIAVAAILTTMALLALCGLGDLPAVLLLGAGLFSSSYLMASGNLVDAGRLRILITLVFGLIHGFGFAADLLELQLPPERLAELLVGFNVGVEIAQLTLVLSVTGLAIIASRSRFALPRPIVVDFASSALIGIGTFWFIQRSFG